MDLPTLCYGNRKVTRSTTTRTGKKYRIRLVDVFGESISRKAILLIRIRTKRKYLVGTWAYYSIARRWPQTRETPSPVGERVGREWQSSPCARKCIHDSPVEISALAFLEINLCKSPQKQLYASSARPQWCSARMERAFPVDSIVVYAAKGTTVCFTAHRDGVGCRNEDKAPTDNHLPHSPF